MHQRLIVSEGKIAMQTTNIFILLLIFFKLALFTQSAVAADSFSAYLFVYFIGNDSKKSQESIFFALSDDAHTFKQLNKLSPVLNSAKISNTGGVRDPHILRGENNEYYMVATDMISDSGWNSNHGIVMLKSTNLTEWQSSVVDLRDPKDATYKKQCRNH